MAACEFTVSLSNFLLFKKIFKVVPKDLIEDVYYVIDIKFTTLKLTCDGIHVLNSGLFPAYKAQLYVYTQCFSAAYSCLPLGDIVA